MIDVTEYKVKSFYNFDMNKDEKRGWRPGDSPGAIYGIGILGTAVYYIVHATTFWMGVFGVIKAVFWPGFLLYRVFELLKM